jgi:ubiquinone/menaquinone biosynthesis C-methylase UbiE
MSMNASGAINKRYSELAESSCCLSCGAALSHCVPEPGEVGVDLGSGRGNDVLRIAGIVGEQGFAYGVDIADGMLESARRKAERLGVHNARFVKSELEKIGLDDEVADFVISNCTINHARDKQAVWKQIFRILKPGGRFVVSDIYANAEVPEEYRNNPALVAECWAGAATRDEYLQTVLRTGFVNIEIVEESLPYDKGEIQVASITLAGMKPVEEVA